MWSLDDGLDRPTTNLFPTKNNTISTGYGPVIQHNIIWHSAWFDWGRKFYCRIPFLTQTCWKTGKLDVFTWDANPQLNSRNTSFVTYQNDNNLQGCAYFFFFWRHILTKLLYTQLALPGGHQKEVWLAFE